MAAYRTKQRSEIADYLASIPGEHVTAGDICAHFRAQGRAVGTATVYRQLERMVSEGTVSKYIIDESAGACFAYIGAEAHCGGEKCYHCKCERCGTLIHMECAELNHIAAHLLDDHGFRLNPMRTVFYGVCAECAAKEVGADGPAEV